MKPNPNDLLDARSRNGHRCLVRAPLALALATALGAVPVAVTAASISVSSAIDPGTTDTCTLRQAITSMNDAAPVGDCAANGNFGTDDTIVFDTSVFPEDGVNIIMLSGSPLDIRAGSLVIDASANGGVTIDANRGSGVLRDTAAVGGSLVLKQLHLVNGEVTGADCAGYDQGAGICIPQADLTLIHSTVSDNSAGVRGGGIYSHDGDIVLSNSRVSGNTAEYGAGILAFYGAVTISNSTVSGNSASQSGGGLGGYSGPFILTNSTISGNSAAVYGGGIYCFNGSATLTNSTVSNNAAGIDGGGADGRSYLSLAAYNSIVAGNADDDLGVGVSLSGDHNLIGSAVDPDLGPLQNNGGPTWTLLPQPGSAAIDAGTCNGGVPASDQRGVPRPQGVSCDIGAVEVMGAVAAFSDGSDFARYGQPRTWVLTLVNRSNTDIANLSVQGNVPPQVDAAAMRWHCSGSLGTGCIEQGSGALSDGNVFLPAHGVATWAITAPIRLDAPGDSVTMSVQGNGVSPSFEVEDTDTLLLFRDGFDVPGGDGAVAVPLLR